MGRLVSLGTLAIAAALTVGTPMAAQGTADVKNKAQPKPWTAPLTPDGQPDLQGNWINRSATPLERPKELAGRQFLTDAEVAEFKRRADRLFKNGDGDAANGDNYFQAVLAN